MKKMTCLTVAFLMVCVAVLAPVAATAGDEKKKACCFSNPRFTGVCKVMPGEDETCSSILAYLNNQQSVGKSYCGNTPIRGGWATVDCDKKQSTDRTMAPVCTQESTPFD